MIQFFRTSPKNCIITPQGDMLAGVARGKFLRLFIGNMASGKTRHLVTEIDTLRRYGNKKIAVFKPRTDTRSGMNTLKSRRGDEDLAEEVPVNKVSDLWPLLRARESEAGCKFQVVAFDEVQFFPRDSGFFHLVKELMDEGYDILASGLAFDFRGEPFGSTADLALLAAENCLWMTSYCTKCGSKAPYPQRIINGVPAHYNSPQVMVGGDETYEPRCEDHFVLPGRPMHGAQQTLFGQIL